MSALLSVQQVRKKYCRSLRRSLLYGVQDIFSDLFFRNPEFALREHEFLALDNVSLNVSPGESVALIGRNGAGKSTLLKLINGLFSPDAGTIKVNGTVAALIELGAGFSPILSGRENIYINAAVLGISKIEVDDQLEEIVDFAELDDFIDTPLKSYSSGMKVRLGFAVASQLRPDLLLIDEVLAVGDAAFRAKCYRRLANLLKEGTAFVLVSHNKHMLLNTCSRGLVLDHGVQISDEPITEALDTYERLSGTIDGIEVRPTESASSTHISRIRFLDNTGEVVREPKTGESCGLNIEINVTEKIDAANIALIIRGSQAGEPLLALSSLQEGYAPVLEPGCHQLHLKFDHFPFVPGNYHCKLSISDGRLNVLDAIDNFGFGVSTGAPSGDSAFYCPHSWQHS